MARLSRFPSSPRSAARGRLRPKLLRDTSPYKTFRFILISSLDGRLGGFLAVEKPLRNTGLMPFSSGRDRLLTRGWRNARADAAAPGRCCRGSTCSSVGPELREPLEHRRRLRQACRSAVANEFETDFGAPLTSGFGVRGSRPRKPIPGQASQIPGGVLPAKQALNEGLDLSKAAMRL
jgi:hypothetical protein